MTARLSLAFLTLAVFTLTLTTLFLTSAVRQEFLVSAEANLKRHAESIATLMGKSMEEVALTPEERRRLVAEMVRLSQGFEGRMCIVNWKGEVLEDSEPDGQKFVRDYPEVYEALNGRYYYEVRDGWLYLAVPMWAEGKTQGAIYASRPLGDLDQLMSGLYYRTGEAALAVLILSAALSVMLGRSISKPVTRLSEGVRRISEGDYAHRLGLRRGDELGRLAADVDSMAASLAAHRGILMQFVSDASHELKTPIASVKALTEGLLDGALEEPERARRFLSLIESEVDRMQHLVESLLCLQRMEGAPAPEMIEFELRELVAELVEPPALKSEVAFEGPAVRVRADRVGVAQVLGNLISNALSAGEPVTVEWRREGEKVIVVVSDGGSGLPEEELERVFLRFYRTEKARSRQSGGSGLGLAICKGIVERHGQRIWLENKGGGGLRACFTLEVVPSEIPAGIFSKKV